MKTRTQRIIVIVFVTITIALGIKQSSHHPLNLGFLGCKHIKNCYV